MRSAHFTLLPLLGLLTLSAGAQPAAPANDAPPEPIQPTPIHLQDLEQEVRAVHDRAHASIVRVIKPEPKASADDELQQRWGTVLDERMLEALRGGLRPDQTLEPVLVPGGQDPGGRVVLVLRPSRLPDDAVSATYDLAVAVGDGSRLLTACRGDAIGDSRSIVLPDGETVEAVVGWSDPRAGLCRLDASRVVARPLELRQKPLVSGELLISVPMDASNGRLILFNGAPVEPGMLMQPDGTLAGLCGGGRVLTAGTLAKILAEPGGLIAGPVLGVRVGECAISPADPAAQGWTRGLRVLSVLPGEPGDDAGILPGDILLTLQDEPVLNIANLAAQLAGRTGTVRFTLLRNDQPIRLDVTLRNTAPEPATP